MKLIYGVLLLCIISVASCSKDKFSSKPTLKIKEVSGNYVPYDPSGTIDYSVQFILEYTDAEGDLADMPVCFQKISSSSPCSDGSRDPNSLDTTNFKIPNDLPATSNQKGEIVITLTRSQDLKPIACNPLDTLEEATFKFWLRDQAGNPSDTVTAPVIKIEKHF